MERSYLFVWTYKNFQHSLDFEKGLLSREFIWEEKSECCKAYDKTACSFLKIQ